MESNAWYTSDDPKSGWRLLEKESEDCCPVVLPIDWSEIKTMSGVYVRKDGLNVVLSVEMKKSDPRKWLHVSLSRQDRLPSWDDIKDVKDLFVGKDKTAAQIFPPKDEYINHNPNVLHLWCCLNKSIFPDFRRHNTI